LLQILHEDKLLDNQLDGLIHKDEYLTKKQKLLEQKTSLREEIREVEDKGNQWLEPAKEFILASSQAKNIAKDDSFLEIKTFLKNIGSNFILSDKKFSFEAGGFWKILAEKLPNSKWLRG